MPESLDKLVEKMPPPEFIDILLDSRIAFSFPERMPILTMSWQWVLAEISESLIAGKSREVIKLLFTELDYTQINKNAVDDVYNIVRQPFSENAITEVKAKIDAFKDLMRQYLNYPQDNKLKLDYIINESSVVLEKLKSLEVVGVGAFMIASGFRLALLQEKAKLDPKWNKFKDEAIEYSDYALKISPKIIKLSLGRINKKCNCTRCGSEFYECRYFDGKDIHVFREKSLNVGTECNRHRLEMFYSVADNVNQTAVQPVRNASKKWRELSARGQDNS